MNPAERKRLERERMRARGYVLKQVWMHPDDEARVAAEIESARLLRECIQALNTAPMFNYANRRTSYQLVAEIERYVERATDKACVAQPDLNCTAPRETPVT